MITKLQKKARRQRRVRLRLRENTSLPRLTVFKSNRYLWSQIIDDQKSITLCAFSTKQLKAKDQKPVAQAFELGKKIAELALAKKIKSVIFDRGPYRYHGQIKALAEGAREGGLKL